VSSPAVSTAPLALDVLARTEFFSDLDRRQLKALAAVSQVQEHEAGVEIYNHGQPARYFYVLAEGLVQFAIGFRNRTSAGDMLRRGSVFGWAALTPGARQRIATATCVTPCTVIALDGNECFALMQADHTLGFHMMTRLNHMITSTLTAFVAG
jgi:toluene monooxygenase system ferredoxin subunit